MRLAWHNRWIRQCFPTARCQIGLFGLFALLYAATATRDYTFDAVSYASQIQSFAQTREWRWLFHPHHLLFNALGYLWYAPLHLVFPNATALAALQWMNALLGAMGVALFAGVCTRACADPGAGILAAAGLGLSYGYWTCSTDGRANMAGVVALIGVLWRIARLADARGRLTPTGVGRAAVTLGSLHALAVLLHQSHALLTPAVIIALRRSPRRWRRLALFAYLSTLTGIVGLAYAAAAHLAAGAGGPAQVLSWATTYARKGHWWNLELLANLRRDLFALLHALVAQPSMTGAATTGWASVGAVLVTATVWALVGFGVWTWGKWRRAASGHGPWPFDPLGWPGAERGPLREVRDALPVGGEAALRRLMPVLLLWVGSYAAFFTVWNPGYFVFWVPVLVPLWVVLAANLAAATTPLIQRPQRWLGATAALMVLAINNVVVGIGPHACAANNGRLQKALAIQAQAPPNATLVVAGAGDDADAEVYIPYFSGHEVVSVHAILGRASDRAHGLASLRAEIDRALANGRRVYLHEELVSSEGPYGVLSARYGVARPVLVRFLRRHYRLGRPVRWRVSVEGKKTTTQRN